MTVCNKVNKEMFKNPILVRVEGALDFSRARELADGEARKRSADPMLLAWYNGRTGEFSPKVECGGEDKPGWLIYAETRGGDIVIDLNDEAYVFVYRSSW